MVLSEFCFYYAATSLKNKNKNVQEECAPNNLSLYSITPIHPTFMPVGIHPIGQLLNIKLAGTDRCRSKDTTLI